MRSCSCSTELLVSERRCAPMNGWCSPALGVPGRDPLTELVGVPPARSSPADASSRCRCPELPDPGPPGELSQRHMKR